MTTSKTNIGLNSFQKLQKRVFDIFFAILGLSLTWWLISAAWLVASVDTRSNGFFIQKRVGRNGKTFMVVKIKTMRPVVAFDSTVTCRGDPRITVTGAFFRRTKIDELPQLWNVLIGDMSFVGPRPDVPGFADTLKGKERAVLSLRPGITGPATLAYRNEELLLSDQDNPEAFNQEVIWPDKVRINLEYLHNWSLMNDLRYMIHTVFQ